MRRVRTGLALAAAWLPLGALWALFLYRWSPEATVAGVVRGAAWAVGWAALLGLAVWPVTGRVPWPDRLRPSFYIVHLAAGLAYAVAWASLDYLRMGIESGRSPIALASEARVLGWQILVGFVFYGLVAGVSYALRIRERLREQERVAARAETLLTEARLRALRAQLNPHFLFNALHTLTELVREEPETAERALERLGKMLRYALDEEAGQEVTLAEEWCFTQHYLALERLRLGERLQVESRLHSGALGRSVPSLVLQPLVENAVRHGVAARPGPGRITITAELANGALCLSVADDGPGDAGGPDSGRRGYGLRSVRERLRALYGEDGALEVETAPGRGFRCRVRIPRDPGEGS